MEKYRIVKKIGKGSFSDVYLVKNNKSELYVKKEFLS